jgi:secondary thiamine-phosphate synthase enzyme
MRRSEGGSLGTGRRITAVRTFTVRTERRTQLVDITPLVQEALEDSDGASAALVYVPHTTAGVTINEGADPAVARDLEAAMEQIVEDGWDWQHVEDPDGPNAPSHVRASLVSPQVLVPLEGGRLALGTWQGIFFCEFDGPRERKVIVTALS